MTGRKIYFAIDLKSFYASVECIERGLDPMTANLVVADAKRTKKTICLAVSPSLKKLGIPGRLRLFEVDQKVKEANNMRKKVSRYPMTGKSYHHDELQQNPSLEIDYIVATPRMALYMDYSARIYNVYLKYVAPEDIHVYSIDEVFMDVTSYLSAYKLTPRQLAKKILKDVVDTTGVTGTVGIGTNLYLCKVAMDIMAKKIEADQDGDRIAALDEMRYRKLLWSHRPLRDFWRVGKGYAKKLEDNGLYTMGDIARCSIGKADEIHNEELLYRLFGVNAELLIDHAWGYESCTMKHIKEYKPSTTSIGTGQVLHSATSFEKARLITWEMVDLLVLDLVDKGLVTNQIVFTVGYDIENLKDGNSYKGEIVEDAYGRKIPKHARGTVNFERRVSSSQIILDAVMKCYDQVVDKSLLVRRINISANHLIAEGSEKHAEEFQQLDLFTTKNEKIDEQEEAVLEREKRMQRAVLNIKKKYGKNSILKVKNLEEGATTRDRNKQIGGHKA